MSIEDLNNIADLMGGGETTQVSSPTPDTVNSSNTAALNDIANLIGGGDNNTQPTPQPTNDNWFEGKTIGGFLKNNLIETPVNLATGLWDLGINEGLVPVAKTVGTAASPFVPFEKKGEQIQDIWKGSLAEKAKDYYTDPNIPIFEKAMTVPNTLISEPLTGQTFQELGSTEKTLGDKLRDIGDYYYDGGALIARLMLSGVPGVGKGLSKAEGAIAEGLTKGADTLTGGLATKGINSFRAPYAAANEILQRNAWDINELEKVNAELEQRVQDAFRAVKMNRMDMTEFIKKVEGREGKNMSMFTDKEKQFYNKIKPVLDKWDDLAQTYQTGTPGNITEIVQRGLNRKLDKGYNSTYQQQQLDYERAGLFDYGQYMTKDGKPVTFPKNKEFVDKYGNFMFEQPKNPKLQNTVFKIPEENLDALALRALDDPLAAQFLQDYKLADSGLLRRISHGTADVQKEGVTIDKSIRKINKPDRLFSERAYGNATAKAIAEQWMNPETVLGYAIKGMMRNMLLDKWWNEFVNARKPIVSKFATPEDMRFVSRETLNDSLKLKNLDSPAYFLKKIPEDANPADYVAIDKHSLKAYRNLFFPDSSGLRLPKLFQDMISITKQAMLAGGRYLGANFLGGVINAIFNSNVNLLSDITNAIRTGGMLMNDLGMKKVTPTINTTRLKFTPKDNAALNAINTINRGLEKAGNYALGHATRVADINMQNTFGEIAAHRALARRGIPFENRNGIWMRKSLTEKEVFEIKKEIEQAALIYGKVSWIPQWVYKLLELHMPFIRWYGQAAESTAWMMKNHPVLHNYLGAAVLGNLGWDENESRALGIGVTNPQSGKIYRLDKNGNTKVTETEATPQLTTVKMLADPKKLIEAAGTNVAVTNLIEAMKPTTKYGKLKRRSDWAEYQPNYSKNVRYKDGIVEQAVTPQEYIATIVRGTAPLNALNKVVIPGVAGAMNKPVYQPYNDQYFVGEGGDIRKFVGLEELGNAYLGQYTHPLYYGSDDIASEKTVEQARAYQQKQEARERYLNEEELKRRGYAE